jgi:ATP-dependent helicase/nuclease subunit A
LLTQKGTPRKLSDKVIGIETVRQAQDCLIDIGQAQTQHDAWLHQLRMARLTRLLVQDYAQLKRERGWLDMGDLERAALALMSDPVLSGWVQERLDARVSGHQPTAVAGLERVVVGLHRCGRGAQCVSGG